METHFLTHLHTYIHKHTFLLHKQIRIHISRSLFQLIIYKWEEKLYISLRKFLQVLNFVSLFLFSYLIPFLSLHSCIHSTHTHTRARAHAHKPHNHTYVHNYICLYIFLRKNMYNIFLYVISVQLHQDELIFLLFPFSLKNNKFIIEHPSRHAVDISRTSFYT